MMKNVNSFIAALGENYYYEFLQDPDSDEVFSSRFDLPIYYKNKFYYEISRNEIHLKRRGIIQNVKEKYDEALSEIYVNLASKDAENFDAFLIFNIEAVKLKLKTLKADFYVENIQSRYYSVIDGGPEIKDFESTDFSEYNVSKEMHEYIYQLAINFKYSRVDILDHIDFAYDRTNALCFLPFSLFLIGQKFISELIKMRLIIQELKESKQINPKIKWSAKKTHIGYILGTLAQNGYIEAPKHKNGEINFTAYAKLIKQNFEVDVNEETLRKYLNPDDDKFVESQNAFSKESFNIPNVKTIS